MPSVTELLGCWKAFDSTGLKVFSIKVKKTLTLSLASVLLWAVESVPATNAQYSLKHKRLKGDRRK